MEVARVVHILDTGILNWGWCFQLGVVSRLNGRSIGWSTENI